MSRLRILAALPLLALVAGCGGSGSTGQPVIGAQGKARTAGQALGFPVFATKNTTRVGGADPVADAAGAAQAAYPGGLPAARSAAVTLVDARGWQAGIAAAVLMSAPIRAPLLFSNGSALPGASKGALHALDPQGSRFAGGAQVIRVGNVAKPAGYKTTAVAGPNVFALARAIDRLQASAAGHTSDRIVVVSSERADFAMPAAAWAAKAGDPVLFVTRDRIPRDTRAALIAHRRPRIYVLGPPSVVSPGVMRGLARLGRVVRIAGRDAVGTAIAFARFSDGTFGWRVVDPGHGIVFANTHRPLDAAAAAPLSATGTYGPLLLIDQPDQLPAPLVQFLLDIQPGYDRDPVRGVYNHGWLIGDERAISVASQARIDALLEIVAIGQRPSS